MAKRRDEEMDITFPNQKIVDVQIEKEVKKSFIEYAMSVIMSRAIPDVRDGLKPVHRRILHYMYEERLTYDKPTRKSAFIVGAVLGRYHPHGDSSVYDAMVRLAQWFSLRYTLVDGDGNFGNLDGDGAAAYRYTEARLSKLANYMLEDIEKDVVDNYNLVSAVCHEGTGLVGNPVTGEDGYHFFSGHRGQVPGLADQLQGDRLDLTVTLLCEYIDIFIIRKIHSETFLDG